MAFEALKALLFLSPLFQLPNFDKTFEVEYDEIKVSIGAVLMQEGKPISYFSEKLKGETLNYSTYDLELYALVRALGNWQHYGKENVVADALSRKNVLVTTLSLKMMGFEILRMLYLKDPIFEPIYSKCEEWGRDRWLKVNGNSSYSRFYGYLFKERRLCVPSSSWRELLVREEHDGGLMGNFGVDKTLGILEEK
ncbi:uncharacterized protein LOC124888867 [Capsicum annuum]|uniref:uncharacterized protein LOC124888867 n=1 Tax=Capsicum annuum TaxID=4072 RepID=UPI001FB0F40B|nr:uncharacterized protein LOC124888867 [Capsicum annuum]